MIVTKNPYRFTRGGKTKKFQHSERSLILNVFSSSGQPEGKIRCCQRSILKYLPMWTKVHVFEVKSKCWWLMIAQESFSISILLGREAGLDRWGRVQNMRIEPPVAIHHRHRYRGLLQECNASHLEPAFASRGTESGTWIVGASINLPDQPSETRNLKQPTHPAQFLFWAGDPAVACFHSFHSCISRWPFGRSPCSGLLRSKPLLPHPYMLSINQIVDKKQLLYHAT